jgi:hypothetical protein
LIRQKILEMDRKSAYSSTFQKYILLVWAAAIMWIYIGNIINFHQHHIWGKQLLPVAAATSRSKEKSLARGNDVQHSQLFKLSDPEIINIPDHRLSNPEIEVVPSSKPDVSRVHMVPIIGDHSLRAPPVA